MSRIVNYMSGIMASVCLLLSVSLADILGLWIYKDLAFIPKSHHMIYLFFSTCVFIISFVGLIREESKVIARVEGS